MTRDGAASDRDRAGRDVHDHTIERTTSEELHRYPFLAGSMGPKVEAAGDVVESTGRPAAIGALSDVAAMVAGRGGTRVEPKRAR